MQADEEEIIQGSAQVLLGLLQQRAAQQQEGEVQSRSKRFRASGFYPTPKYPTAVGRPEKKWQWDWWNSDWWVEFIDNDET